MQKPKSKSRNRTILIIGLTAILVAVGAFIAYTIYQTRQVTPTDSEATLSSCCLCTWELESENEKFVTKYNTEGLFQSNSCQLFDGLTPNDERMDCVSFENEYGQWKTDSNTLASCIDNNSLGAMADPPIPSTDDNEVDLYASFISFASDTNNKGFESYKIEFVYPTQENSPEEVVVDLNESGNPVENENFSLEQEELTLPGDQEATIYTGRYKTTWDEVLDLSSPGTYKVNFSAKFRGKDEWTEISTENQLEITVERQGSIKSFCNNLDISSQGNTTPLDVTLNVDASMAQDVVPIYKWRLDLNCDGTIDEDTQGENAEVFTTSGKGLEAQQITRTFDFSPAPQTQESATCEASVQIFKDEESMTNNNPIPQRAENSCSGIIQLQQASPECGNGTCDGDETCDTNGNISCLSGTEGNPLPAGNTCRQDCTFCGDGILNSNEECDPQASSGQPGYDENCQNDCTIGQTDPPVTPPADDDTPDDDTPDPATTLDIQTSTQQECVELVSPNNLLDINVTITNASSSPQSVRAISDTLPRGFSYQTSSSLINNNQIADTNVIVESSGESQLVTWNNSGSGWLIPASGTLTLNFQATAGPNTQMGDKTNDVTISPADGNPISAQSQLITAQNCSQPDTGIFDNNVIAILLGSALLVIAGAAYYTGFGAEKLAMLSHGVESKYKKAQKNLTLMLTQPQKYMEKKIENSALKDINQHINDDDKNQSKRAENKNNES